jgi:hypothetical protein
MGDVFFLRCELEQLTLIREMMFGVITMMLIELVLLMILIYIMEKNR